ncbi:MAG: saccharopine dehydrogenase NADP-binding domain-containing protein [Rhodococcus sp. (in: high G+C Gram-positive bacteria)]
MSYIAVVGLGHMGLSAIEILCRARPGATFLAVDRSERAVRAATALGDNVEGLVCDVTTESLDLSDVDIVLNLAGPFFAGSDHVARAALASGSTYIDIGDDVEATETILGLDAAAREVGSALVTGAGLSPGVSNWMAGRLLDEHPNADGIQIAWTTREADPGGLAPLRHMLHMAVTPCPVWIDGKWKQSAGFVPSTAAIFDFPEPLGPVETYDTSHPEPLTLTRHFTRLQYASCKGALQPAWANSAFSTLGRIGFGYTDQKIEIDGVSIEPAEFLWKMLWARHDRRPSAPRAQASAVLVQALNGKEVVAALAVADDGAMSRGTGLGAAAAVLTALEERPAPGAWGPEVLAWEQALPLFEKLATDAGGFPEGVTSPGVEVVSS